MLLSGDLGGLFTRCGTSALFVVIAASLTFLTSARRAHAVTYETAPAFCEVTTVHDYLAPFERMPKLQSPPSRRAVFGPAVLRLMPYSSLLVGHGTIGYSLVQRRSGPIPYLDWDITTTLSKVNWHGRVVEVVDQARRHVTSAKLRRGAGVHFEVGDKPEPYRLTVVFRNGSGRKLSSYGSYFRVVAPTENVRLGLNASSYRPGGTVFGHIENFGTAPVSYGEVYRIERYDGSSWTVAPGTSRDWIFIGYTASAGDAGRCNAFDVPPTMAPGRYRMTKSVSSAANKADLSAEFDVVS